MIVACTFHFAYREQIVQQLDQMVEQKMFERLNEPSE